MTYKISNWGRRLAAQYPQPGVWKTGLIPIHDIPRIVNLWITEGIPFVFRELPILYEHLREDVSRALDDDPYAITLVGSARLGYSLTAKRFPRPFIPGKSDLDVAAVCPEAFGKLVTEFSCWRDGYLRQEYKPGNDTEARYWKENAEKEPDKIRRGMFDTNRTPNWPRFPFTLHVNRKLYFAKSHLRSHGVDVRKVTLRVYKDWPSIIGQECVNLKRFACRLNA